MKLPLVVGVSVLVLSVVVTGCADQSPASSTTQNAPATVISSSPTVAWENMPTLTESATTLDCSTYTQGAQTFIRQHGDVLAAGVQYRVATVACGLEAGEVSAEVVEAFVAEDGNWASVGLVSGTDVPFNTTGSCQSDNVSVTCPAFTLGEEGSASGSIEITQQDNGLVWTFVAQ